MKKIWAVMISILVGMPLLVNAAPNETKTDCTLVPFYRGITLQFLKSPTETSAADTQNFLANNHLMLRNLAYKTDGVTGFDTAYEGSMNIFSHAGWKNHYEMYVLHDNLAIINSLVSYYCR